MMPLRAAAAQMEQRHAVGEFCRLARIITEAKGKPLMMQAIAEGQGRLPDRLATILKADPGMVYSPGGSPATWGGFAAYDDVATAFLESLASTNIFDAAAPFMRRVPLKTKVLASAVAATGYIVAEGAAKPISELSLSDEALEPRKAVALLVVTKDLLRLGGPVASRLFSTELQTAVARATDASFVSGIIADTTPASSTGDFLSDLAVMLAAIEGSASSRYFVATEPGTLKTLVTLPGVNGRAHPELTLNGGSVGGVTIVASDGLTSGQMLAFDATQIAADPGTVALDASENATLDMTGGNSPNYSLFQKNASCFACGEAFRLQADARCRCRVGLRRRLRWLAVTLGAKHALAKFGRYLAMSGGDVDRALELFVRYCTRDRAQLPLIMKFVEAAHDRRGS